MQRVKAGFELDPRLESDSRHLVWLGLCELRVMDDRRWPWLMLVPQRPGVSEVHELTPLDQTMLIFEANMVAVALKTATGCARVNTGTLGNIVPQLHFHIVGRNPGDAGWPGPVWGYGLREPYGEDELRNFFARMQAALQGSDARH